MVTIEPEKILGVAIDKIVAVMLHGGGWIYVDNRDTSPRITSGTFVFGATRPVMGKHEVRTLHVTVRVRVDEIVGVMEDASS